MKVKIFGKLVLVERKGDSELPPMLVVGPASLFKKEGLLPHRLYNHFSVYFVDLFEGAKSGSLLDYSTLTLDSFVNAVEQIRVQLHLEKMALFAHSANGVLALEYSKKHNDRVLFNVLIGTMPIWGEYRRGLMLNFFKGNASIIRKQKDKENQSHLSLSPNASDTEKFVAQYKSRKAQFFGDENLNNSPSQIDHLWDDITLDTALVSRYFAVIADYDFRLEREKLTPTFIALGLYDASCPFYAWTDDIKEWFSTKKQTLPFDQLIKLYIFDSDHYPMSPIFNQARPALFMEKLLEYTGSIFENRQNTNLISRL